VNLRRSVSYFGPLDLSTFRLDANLRRSVRPKRDEILGLGAQLDMTSASNIVTQNRFGGRDRSAQSCQPPRASINAASSASRDSTPLSGPAIRRQAASALLDSGADRTYYWQRSYPTIAGDADDE
jgi:hypothetical protein